MRDISIKKTIIFFILTISCIISFLGKVNVYGQEIWTSLNSPYYVNNDTIVTDLIIEPGVEVLFTGNHSFTVEGVFSAVGTQNDSIFFQPAPGNSSGWQGITFNSPSAGLKLDYCSISEGSSNGIILSSGIVTIINTISRNNVARGLNITGGTHKIINSTFKNNGTHGIYLGASANLTMYAIRVSNNVNYGIYSPDGILSTYNSIIDNNGGYGIYKYDGELILENVVVADNSSQGLILQNGLVNITNSIFYGNIPTSIIDPNTIANITYSDIQGPSTAPGEGNINENPRFISNDYKLDETFPSPCIDAGTPGLLNNDKYYPPSLETNNNDMGAYGGPNACYWYYPLYTEPMSIDFGDIDFSETSTETINIRNYSDEILNLDSISITGDNSDKFTIVNMPSNFPIVLAVNESRDFEIEFTPVSAYPSPYKAIINFKSEVGIKTVNLSGKGVQADIFIDPEIALNGYDFGEINVGDSSSFDLIIRNYGTGALQVNDVISPDPSLSFPDFTSFEIPTDPSIAETLKVLFKPIFADTLDGDLIILSNDPGNNGELPITLSGYGMAPKIAVDSTSIHFGEIDVFLTKPSQVSIENKGNLNLSLIDAFISGSAMDQFNLLTEVESDSITVGGEAINVNLEYEPSVPGTHSAMLEILSNDPNNDTLKVTIEGKSVAAQLEVSTDLISFEDVRVQSDSIISFQISNSGERTLEIDTLYLENESNSDFNLQTEQTSFNIEPGGNSYNIGIEFVPTDDISYSDSLVIVSNDYLNDTLWIDISGQGITPEIILTNDTLDFADVWLDQQMNLVQYIYNEGTAVLHVTDIRIAGDATSCFNIESVSSDPMDILPDGGVGWLTIQYVPDTLGVDSARLEINCDDLGDSSKSIQLLGCGVAALIATSNEILNFGSVRSDSNTIRTFQLTNSGNTDLEVSALSIKNNNPEAFFIDNETVPFTISANDVSNEIDIRFAPPTRMNSNAYLNIVSDAYNQDTVKIELQGSSTKANEPYLFVSHDFTIDINNVVITGDSLYSLIINNLSTDAPLQISSLILDGSDATFFMIDSSNVPFEIPPSGQSERRKIRFSPLEVRTYTAQLTINSDDDITTENNEHIFIVNGTGIVDKTPPMVRIDTSVTQLTMSQGGTFQTQILDRQSTIKEAWLSIRPGGGGSDGYQTFKLDSIDGLIWSKAISEDLITKKGLEYYLRIVHGGTESFYPPAPDYDLNPAALRVNIPEYNFPDVTLADDYQMISVPFNSKSQSLSELFGDDLGSYDNTKYRIFDWNQTETKFIEQTNLEAELPPGKALYLITKESQQLNIKDCQTVKTDETFLVELKTGWNMISVPFAFPVLWRDAHEMSNDTDLRYWNGTGWEDRMLLEPFKGYGFYANQDTILNIPANEADTTATAIEKISSNFKEGEWYFQIQARRGRYTDNYNFAGVKYTANDDIDRWDSYEPPGIGENISLFFTEVDESDKELKLSTNYKYAENEYFQFDFEYKSTFLGKTLLNLYAENLPESYDWGVVSRDGDIFLPKGEISSSLQNRQYTLIVGNREYINSIKSEFNSLPERLFISQNYPNPFNPATKITIGLPKEAYVTVDIYNILGECIKRIANNDLIGEGVHEFSWDGKNDHNRFVSSGIYFFTFKTPNYVKTIKMILQR